MQCDETLRLLTAYGNAVSIAVDAKSQFRASDAESEEDFIHLIATMGDAIDACRNAEAALNQHIAKHQCLAGEVPESPSLLMRAVFDPKLPPRDPEQDDPDPDMPDPNPDEPGPYPNIDPDQGPVPLRLNCNQGAEEIDFRRWPSPDR
jgi:hypothetical protein